MADRLAVREARVRVRELGDLPAQTAADAELVISELVANSLLHAHLAAGDVIDVSLVRENDRLLIRVDDHGSYSGRPRSRAGMGVRVLDALCEDWSADSGEVSASLAIGAERGGAAGRREAAPSPGAGRRPPSRPWRRRAS
jgi:anti-sigma regulatory factor (Ser/Thr protein kinase)